ncbi:MAG: class II aldolase [Ignavibacteriae bacterium]|nr:MAG: class II aldolase [Ignavibacteriota bacterium]
MNPEIKALLELSHLYGRKNDYVLAGGGNTSYKNNSHLWIKASGTSLAELTEDGLVCLSRQCLGKIYTSTYSIDVHTREEEVKKDMLSCVVSSSDNRPSVETSLHDCVNFPFVVHTHPTLVNAVMCSRLAEESVHRLFGDSVLYVEYTDPGYVLFKKVNDRIQQFTARVDHAPEIIFLQNHGVFVAGNTMDDIKNTYRSIEQKIKNEVRQWYPDPSHMANTLEPLCNAISAETGKAVLSANSELIQYYASDHKKFETIARPFTPDSIVYCKSNYIFVEHENDVMKRILLFEKEFGHLPKIILVNNKGLIALDDSLKTAETAMEVFEDMMKFSYLSENFGGPHCMSDEQIQFINTWEVENYRRKINRGL